MKRKITILPSIIAVNQGGTGVTISTGTGVVVLGSNPTLTAATLAGDIDADGFDLDDAGVVFLREQGTVDGDVGN